MKYLTGNIEYITEKNNEIMVKHPNGTDSRYNYALKLGKDGDGNVIDANYIQAMYGANKPYEECTITEKVSKYGSIPNFKNGALQKDAEISAPTLKWAEPKETIDLGVWAIPFHNCIAEWSEEDENGERALMNEGLVEDDGGLFPAEE